MGLIECLLCTAAIVHSVAATLEFTKNIIIRPGVDRPFFPMRQQYFEGKNHLWVIDLSNSQAGVATIPPPLSAERKQSMSMMLWPFIPSVFNDSDPMFNCSTRLGYNMVPPNRIRNHYTDLTHSYLYFERLRINDSSGATTTHFISVTLDKTSPNSALTTAIRGNVSESSTVKDYTCDNILQIRKTKFLVFCWKSSNETDLLTKKHNYRIHIAMTVWNPEIKNHGLNTSLLHVNLTEAQYIHFINLNNHYLYSTAISSLNSSAVEVVLFFRAYGLFVVTNIQNDRFNRTIYPLQTSIDEREIKMVPVKDENGQDFEIYNVQLVKEQKFLLTKFLTDFDQFNSTSYPKLFYFDLQSNRPPVFIGKGMILSFKKALDAYAESSAAEILLIIHAQKNNSTTGAESSDVIIQRRTFYEGYFYGSNVFKMTIYGQPRNYRAVITKDFLVFVDPVPDKNKVEKCANATAFVTRLVVAPIQRPDQFREVMSLERVIGLRPRVLVSRNHNLLWVRFGHKIEVFDLLDIDISFGSNSSQFSLYVKSPLADSKLNTTFNVSEENSYKIITTPNLTYPDFEAKSAFSGKVLQFRNGTSEIFEIATNDKPSTTTKNSVKLLIFYSSEKQMFSGSFDELVTGNYLGYEPNPASPGRTDIALFEKKAAKLVQSAKIDKLYCMEHMKQRFILVSFNNNKGNIVYKYNPTDDQLTQAMYFYDNRTVDSVQKLSSNKYLAHIQGMLYELDLEKLELVPVFKSNDMCGDLIATVPHDTYGFVTVCAGRAELNIFISKDEKVDLSTPVNNLEIAPTLVNMLKSEKVMLIISSYTFSNRFITVSMPENNTDLQSIGNWTTRVKVRIYEICPVKQTVEIVPEFEEWIYFKEYIVCAFAHIVQNRLIIFSSHGSQNSTKEAVRVLTITPTYDLVADKAFEVPRNIRLNVQKHNPFSTILPSKKTLLHKTYGAKILMLATILTDTEDVTENFDFFDFEVYKATNQGAKNTKNIMAIFDPTQTSFDCIKLFELPDGHEPYTFGPYFMETSNKEYVYGAAIAGEANNSTKVFFFNDHSLYLELYSFKDLDSFFTAAKAENYSFSFFVKNYLTEQKRMVNISMHSKIYLERDAQLFSLKKEMEIKLTDDSNKVVKFSQLVRDSNNSNLSTDLIQGSPFRYDFTFDSWIEMASQQISASCYTKVQKFPDHLVRQVVELVSYKPYYDQDMNSFNISPLERIYKLQAIDFADLLFASRDITFPMVLSSSNTVGIAANPHLSGKTRCTKFFFKDYHKSPVQELVACIGLKADDNYKMRGIDVFIFNERSESNAYKLDQPLPKSMTIDFKIPISYLELFVTSTLNHLVIIYTIPNSPQSYRYEVFRVSNRDTPSVFKCSSIISGDTWSTDLQVTSSFYNSTGVFVERICMISTAKRATLVLNYLCYKYVFNNISLNESLLFKEADIFESFEYEDLKNVPIELLIYEPTGNPVATDDDQMIVQDKMLYFIFSMPANLAVFARIDPDYNYEASALEKGFKFSILCNPFPGYKFAKEMHVASERYYARVLVSDSKSFISFYSLPSVYADMVLKNYSPIYNQSELLLAQALKIPLKCIEPKQIEVLNFIVDEARPIRFNKKDKSTAEKTGSELTEDSDKRHINTLFTLYKPSLIYDRFALNFLLTSGFSFYRVEFIPRFEVLSKSPYLLSDYVKIDIRGMHNRTAAINIKLLSGKITELWFIFIYMLPVVAVAVLICLLNYTMNFAFTRITSSALSSTEALNNLLISKLLSAVEEENKTDAELQDARNQTSKHSSLKSTPSKPLPVDREDSNEHQQEMEMLLREACFRPVTSKDLDYLQEVEDTDSIRLLYFEGIFQVRTIEETERALNQQMIEENRRPLVEQVIEEEHLRGVPETRMHDYKQFEEYMHKRREVEKQKATLKRLASNEEEEQAKIVDIDSAMVSLRNSMGHKSKLPTSKPDLQVESDESHSEDSDSDEATNKKAVRQTVDSPSNKRRQRK